MISELGKEFSSETAKVNGATIRYVRGGQGPAMILIHGFPQDWSEYHTIMPRLAKRFTVIAVDLRGIGESAAPPDGYDAANMAQDIHELATALKLEPAYIVGHDIGGMVAYAFVRRYPEATRGATILDVPLPGIDGWNESQNGPAVWHVGFMQVPGLAEKLVTGRTADYLDYFFNFSNFTQAEKEQSIKAYSSPAQLHAAFEIYRAFPANEKFNAAQKAPLDTPIFLAAGEKSPFVKLLPKLAEGLRANGCSQVETAIIPDSVHYVVGEQPDKVADLIERHASMNSK
jgi:pimeloyl-ACP methyl ester carboxylesterase